MSLCTCIVSWPSIFSISMYLLETKKNNLWNPCLLFQVALSLSLWNFHSLPRNSCFQHWCWMLQMFYILFTFFQRQPVRILKYLITSISIFLKILIQNISLFDHQQCQILTCIHYPLHFSCMYKRQTCLLLMCSNYVLNTIFKQVILILMAMKYCFHIIQRRTSQYNTWYLKHHHIKFNFIKKVWINGKP